MKKAGWMLVVILGVVVVLLLRLREGSISGLPESSGKVRVMQDEDQNLPEKTVEPSFEQPEISEPANTPKIVLSDEVEKLLSQETPFVARAQLIKELTRSLSSDDVGALRDFLSSSATNYLEVRPIVLNSLKNDVLEVLMDQHEMPEGLGQQVADMFNDPDSDYMWREYCLQFMAPYYQRRMKDDNVADDDSEVAAVTDALFGALDERDEDLAGTALLGLDKLGKKYDDFDHGEVIRKAIEIAEDIDASARCRLTAMRVAAAADSEGILPTARELAQNAETDLLQGAAITTLGDFADPQDKELLTQLAATGNRQISAAARAALNKYKD